MKKVFAQHRPSASDSSGKAAFFVPEAIYPPRTEVS